MGKAWRVALGVGLLVGSLAAASAASAWDGHGHGRVLWASPMGATGSAPGSPRAA